MNPATVNWMDVKEKNENKCSKMGHTKKYLIKKAGMAFKGQLEQNFVVLKEDDAEAVETNFHRARMNRSRGRPRGAYQDHG